MAVVYLTKCLGLREETGDAKVYITKNVGLRQETQTAAAATDDTSTRSIRIPGFSLGMTSISGG